MPAEMTMNRLIHEAVRRDLSRIEAALRALPDGDTVRAQGIVRAWDHLCSELVRHHEGEDAHVWPLMATFGVDPQLLAAMESEHQAMSDALTAAGAAVRRAAGTAGRADVDAAADAVAETTRLTTAHLDHEEEQVEPLLIPHFTSPEWKAAERQLRKGGPTQAGNFFAWVQDGMTPEGRAYLSRTVPSPVVFLLTRVFGRSYQRDVAPVWAAS